MVGIEKSPCWKLLPLAAMRFFHAARDGFLDLRLVEEQDCGGCLKQIPF